jgi:peptidoglycan/xylan/chitin deacetylase (PgdA/CDA1 family)
VLTFDDGYYNNVLYAEPLLTKYGMRAIIFICGEFSEQSTQENAVNANYSYVMWDEIAAMKQRGVWDIQSHSWGLHHNRNGRGGVTKRRGEPLDDYRRLMMTDCDHIGDKLVEVTGVKPTAFAYPLGCTDDASEQCLRDWGIKITFGSHQKTACFRKGDTDSLKQVKRYLRTNRCSAEALLGG